MGFLSDPEKREARESKMPYGNSIPIKNAGRVMEQFVKIVVPRGSQAASSGISSRAGVDGWQCSTSKYQQNGSSSNSTSNSTGSLSSGSEWKQHSWAQN